MPSVSLPELFVTRPETFVFETPLQREMASAVLARMRRRGLTTTKLAEKTGYDRTTIHALLTGRRDGSLRVWSDVLAAVGSFVEVR